MSYLRYQMGAGIESTCIPKQPPKKPRNPSTPDSKPIPKEKVKAEVGNG